MNSTSNTYLITFGFNIAVGSTAMLLNSILLLVLYLDPLNKFRTPSTILVTNLAIADALTGFFVTTRTIMALQGDSNRGGFVFIFYSTLWAIQCSLFTVFFIAWERLFAVAYPFRFRNYVTKIHMFFLSLAGWLISLVLSCLLIVEPDDSGTVTFLTFGCLNFLITCFIIAGYYCIYKVLKRKHLEMGLYGVPSESVARVTPQSNSGTLKRKRTVLSENKRLVNTFLVITIILLLTVIPMIVLTSTAAICSRKCSISIFHILIRFEPLLMVNFIVNPLVYAFQLPTYRQAFFIAFSCRKKSNIIQPEVNT